MYLFIIYNFLFDDNINNETHLIIYPLCSVWCIHKSCMILGHYIHSISVFLDFIYI